MKVIGNYVIEMNVNNPKQGIGDNNLTIIDHSTHSDLTTNLPHRVT